MSNLNYIIKKYLDIQKTLAIVLLVAICCAGCKKFVKVGAPPTYLTSDLVFTSDKSALAAMLSVYTNLMADVNGSNGSFVCFTLSSLGSMSANEMVWTQNNTTAPVFQQFNDHNLTPDNTYVRAMWLDGYKYIYRSNAILEGLETSTNMSDSVKQQLKGEALFMRAFCHFYLLNLFGKIPVITSTDYTVNMIKGQSTSEEAWSLIEADLVAAKSLMKPAYPSAEKLRPNSYTAAALLARSYLYRGKWAEAEKEADAIIQSGSYSGTLPALADVFKKESPETIWQMQPVAANSNTVDGSKFLVAGTVRPNYELTSVLINAFESGDKRRTTWIGNSNTANPTWLYPAKYKAGATATVTEYYVVFRLTEQYLIRAEAKAQLNKLSEALTDINKIRARAGLGVLQTQDKNVVLAAIEQERQVEFFAEWGHRWFDLKRTNRAEAVLKPFTPGNNWKAGYVYYPIPTLELNSNPRLSQNPDY